MLLKKSAQLAVIASLALALFGCSDDDGVSANNHIVLTSSSSVACFRRGACPLRASIFHNPTARTQPFFPQRKLGVDIL